jgi:hypothetical protein
MSEVERDEWRGYFDGMLKQLRVLGYVDDRNPQALLVHATTPSYRSPERPNRRHITDAA